MKEEIEQFRSKEELIEYIVETDKIIGSNTEEDDPKPFHELGTANREQLENYLQVRVAYLKLLIDGDAIH
jgi:hypothetical protein